MYVHIYVHVYIYIYIYTLDYSCIYIYTHIACTHDRKSTHVCVCVSFPSCVHVCFPLCASEIERKEGSWALGFIRLRV